MADFSQAATTLAAPQGAGSQPVDPVRPVTKTDTGDLTVAKTVTDLLTSGIKDYQAVKSEERKQSVIKQFVEREDTIASALTSGQLTPQEADARSRANFRKYAAGYSEYIGEFEKAAKALRGYTELGVAEEQAKTQRDLRTKDLTSAQEAGYVFPANMTTAQQDSQILAHKTDIKAKAELDAFYKKQAESRAQGTYNQQVADRESKTLATRLINDIAGSNITAFQDFARSLGSSVREGKMAGPEALATLNSRYANISAAIQSAASTNPELAAPYRTLFESIYQTGQKLVDPKENLEAIDNQLKTITTQMKLIAMSDPKIAATVVANQLLPNNPDLAIASTGEGIRAITLLSSTALDQKGFVPQVVGGEPEVEKETLNLLKESLGSLYKSTGDKKELAIMQASNSVNQILKQTGQMIDRGASPEDLKEAAKFFASPQYAKFITEGKISPEAAQTAKKTFQLLYEPAVMRSVKEKLDTTLFTSTVEVNGKKQPMRVGNVVDIQFNGSGISFVAKDTPGLSPAEKRTQRIAVENLKSAQMAINQVIHIGAHMEGTTDYAKYWEENKHTLMPNVFPDPVQLKPGAVVDGYKYLGGPYNDKRSWEKQPDKPTQP